MTAAGAAMRHPNFSRRPPLKERLESKITVDPSTQCWVWQFGLTRGGYGALAYDGVIDTAPRHSWRAYHGKIPKGLYVLHKCDNRLCINPEHLFLGTHADNQRDKIQKGRNVPPPKQFGEKNPAARLTECDVRDIRASKASPSEIIRKYSISKSNVWLIRKRKAWKHVL